MKRTLLLLCALLGSAASSQQGPASTSVLLRIPLTNGAVRVTDATATRKFGQLLNALAKDQNSGCQTSEYLVWDNADLAEQISDNLASQFKARSMTFSQLAEDEDDESYSLSFLLTEKSNRYVGVLYGDAESVVLGWCQLKAARSQPAVKPAPAPPPMKAAPAPTKVAPKPAAKVPAPGKYGCAQSVPRFLNGSYTYEIETRGYFNLLSGGAYKDVYGAAGRWRFDAATGLTHFSGSGFDRATAELLEGGRLWIVIPTASGEMRWTCSRV
ncbi:hypothetical protein GCM10008955_16200 [Deinococcus malanensis]|uniref:Uncharacterized protein n=1 Tax=Deinococcus malanensis TaxID=1706855 RepID=A0ABQ2ESW2_9DEIO|nr:hypothetical protein [Deinococcus malanensis]GGK23362.1 hypothetical protein GCM10008955_16200 [Deinococcus malanensis]